MFPRGPFWAPYKYSDCKFCQKHVLWYILYSYSIRSPPNLDGCVLKLNDKVLRNVKQFNNLGVIIDTDLSFEAECQKVHSVVYAGLYHIGKIKSYIDLKIALFIHKQMVLPMFHYGHNIDIMESGSDWAGKKC